MEDDMKFRYFKNKSWYKCQYCSENHHTLQRLKEHQSLGFSHICDDDYNPSELFVSYFTCKVCKFSTTDQDNFSKHYLDTYSKLKLECIGGDFSIVTECIVNNSNSNYKCDKCNQQFYKNDSLLLHIEDVHKEKLKKKLKCPKCDFQA